MLVLGHVAFFGFVGFGCVSFGGLCFVFGGFGFGFSRRRRLIVQPLYDLIRAEFGMEAFHHVNHRWTRTN